MGEVLALALGIAASPFGVIPAILLLFTASPRPTSLAFLGGRLGGRLGGIGVVVGVFVVLAQVLDPGGESPTWLSWVRIVAGLALVGYGAREWITRHASADLPGWLRSIQDATPRTAVRLALLLTVANPKVLLGVAIPVVAYAVRGDAVLPPLERAQGWLLRNNAAVMAVVITVIGVVLITSGVTGL